MLKFLNTEEVRDAVGINNDTWSAITEEEKPSAETLKKIMDIGNTLYGVPTNVHERYKAITDKPQFGELAIPKMRVRK